MKRRWVTPLAAAGLVAVTGLTAYSASADDATPAKPATVAAPAPDAPPPPPPGPRDMRRGPDMRLAQMLAGAETLLGIHADQLDAWNDYASALLAVMQPPAPPAPPAAADADSAKAFAREERMIQDIKQRAAKADVLGSAITALRAKLTPDQLAKLADLDLRAGPPHGGPGDGPRGPGQERGWHFGGFAPFGHGDRGGPDGDRGPGGRGPGHERGPGMDRDGGPGSHMRPGPDGGPGPDGPDGPPPPDQGPPPAPDQQ